MSLKNYSWIAFLTDFKKFKILYAKDVEQRSFTFEKSIEMGKEYQKRTKAIILRSLIMKYNINVKVIS